MPSKETYFKYRAIHAFLVHYHLRAEMFYNGIRVGDMYKAPTNKDGVKVKYGRDSLLIADYGRSVPNRCVILAWTGRKTLSNTRTLADFVAPSSLT